MAHDVFVSYSHKDKPVADAVTASLESRGIRCWIAPRDITPGASWGEAIVDAIEGSRVMVIILSTSSIQSRQVIREVERSVAKGLIIIPFLIENVEMAGAMAYFLATEHWLDALTPPLEKHIEKLGDAVQLFLSTGDKDTVKENLRNPVAFPSAARKRSRPMWIYGASIFILAAVAILLIIAIPKLLAQKPLDTPAASTSETQATTTPTQNTQMSFNVIGEFRTSGSANGLFIANNILTLANGSNGLIRLQTSDPKNPKEVDTFLVGDQPAQRVFVDGNIAYVITGEDTQKLVIMQLQANGKSTTFPSAGQSIGNTSSLYNITVANNLAHLTGHNYWGILDVSDPMHPKELWKWAPPGNSGNPCNVITKDNVAYISCGWAGLFIFDITDPQNPVLIETFETPDWIIGIDLSDQVLYVTLGNSGLLSFDISDPMHPLLLDRLNLPGFATRLSVSGDLCYVIYILYEANIEQGSGVVAVNVSDPEKMQIVATYDELSTGSDIQVAGDNVFVTEKMRGVVILNLNQ